MKENLGNKKDQGVEKERVSQPATQPPTQLEIKEKEKGQRRKNMGLFK